MRKLKFFSDRSYLLKPDQYVTLLYPFWGYPAEDPDDPDRGKHAEFTNLGDRLFAFTDDVAEADFVLLPGEWKKGSSVAQAEALATVAAQYGKKLVIFFNDDSDEEIPIPDSIVFRTSFYRATRKPNEHGLPAWSLDFRKYCDGQLPVSEWKERPVVSYCGYVDYRPGDPIGWALWKAKKAYSWLRGLERSPGPALRGEACRRLLRSRRLETRFIFRDDFWAGMKWYDFRGKRRVREEYIENMAKADYCLVTRGAGNFSFRFYEVMSLGKIPVFLDTDCVLPFDDLVDWKSHFVWLEQGRHDRVEEAILEFHRKFTPESFVEHQLKLRALYEEWLSAVGFFHHLGRFLPSVHTDSETVQGSAS